MRFISENPVVSCFMLAIIGISAVLITESVRPYPIHDTNFYLTKCITDGTGRIANIRTYEIAAVVRECKTTFNADESSSD